LSEVTAVVNIEDSELVMSSATKTYHVYWTTSHFITPSSVFYESGDPRKDKTIDGYKARMSTIPCKYFAKSRAKKPFCPFGRDCFYQHLNADGTPYIFEDGVDKLMEEIKRRKSRAHQQRSARALMELNAGLDAIAESLLFEIPAVLQHMGEDYYYEEDVDDWEDEEDEEDLDDVWGELFIPDLYQSDEEGLPNPSTSATSRATTSTSTREPASSNRTNRSSANAERVCDHPHHDHSHDHEDSIGTEYTSALLLQALRRAFFTPEP